MLKIVVDSSTTSPVLVVLEGQVIGPWVRELERVCEPILAGGAGLHLDLASVSFLSREGVHLLCMLRRRRVALLRCSAFVTEQLKSLEEACA
jgi:hypothetical protein